MSLWWARRDQLDVHQVQLIEDLSLRESHLVLGPPGSGKTNVLLRRAQFVRSQEMPNLLVLTFTRALTEFVKTGCFDEQGREIFPQALVSTLEAWIRWLYAEHEVALPPAQAKLPDWKAALAMGAVPLAANGRIPRYDAIFVDEAQDLMAEEVQLLRAFSDVLFFVGDDRQQIYEHAAGLDAVRALSPRPAEHLLPFHYRLAEKICEMADRIETAQSGERLEKSSHYNGPRPGRIEIRGPLDRGDQVVEAIARIKDQVRVYSDLIQQGDRIGIVVARREDRAIVHDALERDPDLRGLSQVVRARDGSQEDREFNPAFDPSCPISIVTMQGCKGLEFCALHWLFCDDLSGYHNVEHYYTVVTRAKTSLHISYTQKLPQVLARSYAPASSNIWGD